MAKTFEKAVTGFNHNIKHKGKVYHVQTEDSGVNNPHVITHLFVGGNILASKKTSYADIVKADNLQEVVRQLMEEQHKEMLRNLVNGVYETAESASSARHYQPGQLGTPQEQIPNKPPATRPPAAAPSAVSAARAPAPPPAPGAAAKPPSAKSLFGEDVISEKSLDEVILSYLAGDGDS